ncbi:hypothetical protein PHISP_00509 [Aspergillus sp. HF37]|nr:hypothetical protein PHISP_00509 [Aspergillus sp. HF37]
MSTGPSDQALKIEAPPSPCRFDASDALQGALDLLLSPFQKPPARDPDRTAAQRQHASIAADSLDKDSSLQDKVLHHDPVLEDEKSFFPPESVLYLAYGSNLSSKTFRGTRGIKPLSQINVVVPQLRLTFDMPGFPYAEPCFAATRLHTEAEESVAEEQEEDDDDAGESSEKDHLIAWSQDYHRDTWLKPLVGVVYEVSLADYARIIATEGGGRGYKDIVVDCYPFPDSYRPSDPVPDRPVTSPFKAHSLLSPAAQEGGIRGQQAPVLARKERPPGVRPDPSHAQPSPRYLGLITAGAAEHGLPLAYRDYLAQIRPYRVTTSLQAIGRLLFAGMWAPSIILTMVLSRACAGPDGRSPAWLVVVSDLMLRVMWWSYDAVFVRVFGEGERTIGDDA